MQSNFDTLLPSAPYSLERNSKSRFLTGDLNELTRHHYKYCEVYRKLLDGLGFSLSSDALIEELPLVPIRLFKTHNLQSVDARDVVKTLNSSGTGSKNVSKVFLDAETAKRQIKVLSKILTDFLGPRRLPMLIVDNQTILDDRRTLGARGAGIAGFSMVGSDPTFLLDDENKLRFDVLDAFTEKYQGRPILIFGLTYLVWQHLYKSLKVHGRRFKLTDSVVFHGGGWKRLESEAVSKRAFKDGLEETLGVRRIHNYFGMVEQAGSIFIECEKGYFHCSNYSDVIVRDKSLNVCDKGAPGILQLFSILPRSYPGHNILTEDMGRLIGNDDCECNRLGRYFIYDGRTEGAPVRGCSNVLD